MATIIEKKQGREVWNRLQIAERGLRGQGNDDNP